MKTDVAQWVATARKSKSQPLFCFGYVRTAHWKCSHFPGQDLNLAHTTSPAMTSGWNTLAPQLRHPHQYVLLITTVEFLACVGDAYFPGRFHFSGMVLL